MNSNLRTFLLFFAAGVVATLIGKLLDKRFSKSTWRDAVLYGVCVYGALLLDSWLSKQSG